MFSFFLIVVDKVAADPIGAEADCVERATRLCFVFWMPAEIPQLVWPVGKLAFPAILAQTALSERSTQFSLVAGRGGGVRVRCAGADVTLGVLYVSPRPA